MAERCPLANDPRVKRVLFHFKVMYSGWECDEDAWVVEFKDGSRAIVETSHNSPFVAEEKDVLERIGEYEKVLADTRKALEMVTV